VKTTGVVGRKLEKLDTLTSLRFFAAAFIVIHHGNHYLHTHILEGVFLGQAVSFFFVLSGFVLAYAYPKLPSKKHAFRFLWARFSRVWPAHIFTFILLIIALHDIKPLFLSEDNVVWVFISNLLLVHSWFPERYFYFSANSVSWSISTEFFFYLIFPLFIYKWHSTWHWKLLTTFLLLIGMIILSKVFDIDTIGMVYINPLSRIFEFSLGIATCSLFKVLKNNANNMAFSQATFMEVIVLLIVGLTMFIIPILASSPRFESVVGNHFNHWFQSSGGCLSFAFFILIFSFQKGVFSSLLKYKWLVFGGEISFSLYLIHQIVLRYYINYQGEFNAYSTELIYTLYWLIAIMLSVVSFVFIENPSRRFLLSIFSSRSSIDIENKNHLTTFIPILLIILFLVTVWFYRPASYLKLTKHDVMEMTEQNYLANSALFSDTFELQRLEILDKTDGRKKILFLWKCETGDPSGYQVGVHFLNHEGKIIGQATKALGGIKTKGLNQYWMIEIDVPIGMVEQAENLGVALYITPENLLIVSNTNVTTDWNHRRLIVPLHKDLK